MTSDSTLGVEAEVLQPARRRHLTKTQIRKAAPDPTCDCYAPAPKRCKCVDPQGYHRKSHEYLVDSRRGRRCCWCAALERSVSMDCCATLRNSPNTPEERSRGKKQRQERKRTDNGRIEEKETV